MRWAAGLFILLGVSCAEAQEAGRWISCKSFNDASRLVKVSYKLALHLNNTGGRQCGRVTAILKRYRDFSCKTLPDSPADPGSIVSTNSLLVAHMVEEDPGDDRYTQTPTGYALLPNSKQDIADTFARSECRQKETSFFVVRLYSNGVLFIQ